MAKIETTSAINQIHGKTNGRDRGYFYMRNGKQFYRDRDETYQQNQSPRQKWNSAAGGVYLVLFTSLARRVFDLILFFICFCASASFICFFRSKRFAYVKKKQYFCARKS